MLLGDNDRTHYPILPGVLPSENEVDEYYLTGWEGDFLLDGDPETLCLLYQTGLGDRNSQGFGMFRMLL